jgi:hypothetical protein
MKKFIVALFLLSSLVSCTTLPPILPEDVKKVYVNLVENNTNQHGLESKCRNSIIEEIINSGRLSFVDKEKDADINLTVTIKRYIFQPLTYDINNLAEQYKMCIIASVSLVNNDNKVTLWTEPNMEELRIYRDCGDAIDEAIGESCTRLGKKVVRRVVKWCIGCNK